MKKSVVTTLRTMLRDSLVVVSMRGNAILDLGDEAVATPSQSFDVAGFLALLRPVSKSTKVSAGQMLAKSFARYDFARSREQNGE